MLEIKFLLTHFKKLYLMNDIKYYFSKDLASKILYLLIILLFM